MNAADLGRRRLVLPYLLAVLAAAIALMAFWYERGRPLVLADAATPAHKLQCVSYTPFASDQSPLRAFVVRPERVDADFALLAQYFDCVRTYSVTGMEAVPALAAKHGLKVMLGAWIGSDAKVNRREIELLVSAAQQYPTVVQALIVGNEALLRKEISGAQLARLIAEVKSRVTQPVTYADVWEFWLKHPEVAPEVDFITIHLLPYWEDDPTGIDEALAHVAAVREEFGRRFAPKDILIGETGWPSAGRQRETAVPSRSNQARFVRGFVAAAEHNGWRYNLIEAFDQPWKRANEGAVGGYWGLFDAERHDKQILAGPVSDAPAWRHWLLCSALVAAAALWLAGRPRDRNAALLLPLLAALGGVCVGLWLELTATSARNLPEWLWAGLLAALNLLVLALAVLALARRTSSRERLFAALQRRAGDGLLAVGFVGALVMLQLVFDARYREFPSCVLLLPALVYLLRPAPLPRREGWLLLAIVAVSIPLQLLEEGPRNIQALGWAGVCVVLCAALWRGVRTSRNRVSNSATLANVTV